MIVLLRTGQVGRIHRGERCQLRFPVSPRRRWYVPGSSYAAYCRGEEQSQHLGLVAIVAIERSTLDLATEQDALEEGFDSLAELFAWWRERHGTGPLAKPPVRVVYLHADHDPVRIPARHGYPGRDEQDDLSRGYTRSSGSALPQEPEAVSEQVQRELSAQAWLRFANFRAQQQLDERIEPIDRRLQQALTEAQKQGLDVSRQLAAIERRIDAIRNKTRREAA